MKFTDNSAFTIAEMLVTLMIIGVVFALYTPTLSSAYKKNVTQATLSDAIKNFNHALFNYSQIKHCNGNLACTDLFNNDEDEDDKEDISAAEKLADVFEGSESKESGCLGNVSTPTADLSDYSCIIDGKNVIFATRRLSNCSTDLRADNNKKHKLQNSCGYVYIDINGTDTPNTFGKDVFIFVITNNAPSYLYPVGGEFWQDDNNFNGIGTCPTDGRACAGDFVKNRGKITYDY